MQHVDEYFRNDLCNITANFSFSLFLPGVLNEYQSLFDSRKETMELCRELKRLLSCGLKPPDAKLFHNTICGLTPFQHQTQCI